MITSITISHHAQDKLYPYRQDRRWEPESGGILLGKVIGETAYVNDITLPQVDDLQERRAFEPDLPEHFQAEVPSCEIDGDCYIGEWHTHPERHPEPSAADLHVFGERSKAMGKELVFMIAAMYNDENDRFFVASDGKVFEME